MLGSEFVVDWIKHCFILKFNNMSADIYAKFSMILRSDVLDARNEVSDLIMFPLVSHLTDMLRAFWIRLRM